MRDFRVLIFLTFVASSLFATLGICAPNEDLEPALIKEPIQDVNDPLLNSSSYNLRKGDKIIQLNAGGVLGQLNKKWDSKSYVAYGLAYDWRDLDQNYWSLSGRWITAKLGWLEVGKKFIILPENLYEPYYKLSISNFVDPDDALAAITRIDSFKVGASFGVLDMWMLGRILGFEMGAHWGLAGLAISAQASLQWSF